ncbi:hypothetical protein [Bradyrhizobium sp. LHD-71]|uniref:hypothetical protein n=1 Tax=Bradyrhizobium sp. LHD-71 TaxID=3072141 RepID=UPI00280D1AFE|nr:hypothetical protein [Bradyrhizobium sp. LHD-71]MDQ8729609.1 hypothetical protein [Bradyrhizobium sp. LHD-71]
MLQAASPEQPAAAPRMALARPGHPDGGHHRAVAFARRVVPPAAWSKAKGPLQAAVLRAPQLGEPPPVARTARISSQAVVMEVPMVRTSSQAQAVAALTVQISWPVTALPSAAPTARISEVAAVAPVVALTSAATREAASAQASAVEAHQTAAPSVAEVAAAELPSVVAAEEPQPAEAPDAAQVRLPAELRVPDVQAELQSVAAAWQAAAGRPRAAAQAVQARQLAAVLAPASSVVLEGPLRHPAQALGR